MDHAFYKPAGFALEIFQKRYAIHERETFAEACDRVAYHVSQAEYGESIAKHRQEFAQILKQNLFMPGGRIWYGSSRPKGQLLNCVQADTLIHTKEYGLVKASSIEGQTVHVLSDGGVYREAAWACYGEQPLWEVGFENGDTILCTEKHEWVVPTWDRKKYKRVFTRDLLNTSIPLQSVTGFEYDEEEWYWGVRHGLTFGDGNLYMKGRYSTLNQFGDSLHLVTDFFDESEITRYNDWHWNVRHLPSTYKSLPDASSSLSYLRGFLAGLIAADGNVSNGSVVLHNKDRNVLETIRVLASHCGIPSLSIRLAREHSPFDGSVKPLYRINFAKSAFFQGNKPDLRLILKNKHQKDAAAHPSRIRSSLKVTSVFNTGRVEKVFCCIEPQTHTMVIGTGYLTGQCFVTPTEDSREGWGKTTSDMIIISGTGGGVGTNFSPIRPRGSTINGSGGKATGAVSLMSGINAFGEVIKAGGGRRTALMMALAHNHGDIMEFLDAKLDHNKLNNANVSVIFDENPELFFAQVRKDVEVELKFHGKVVGRVRARDLWHKIVANALKSGEPGILNGYLANKMSNIWYHTVLLCSNPCGEIFLSAYESCCLGSIVLPRFVDEIKKDLDWEELKKTVFLAVRFLDDVLTVNTYPLPEIKTTVTDLRRIGLGVMGLHDMLLMLGMKYNSSAGLEFVDQTMSHIKNWAYEASIALAQEKAPFPKFNPELFCKSGFIKTLKPSLREKIREHGVRNCALLTIAPTGTTSMVAGVTSGIEPMFAAAYLRKYQDGDKLAEEVVVHPLFKRFMEEGHSVKHFQGAHEIRLRDHFEMQRTCQKHLDNACSKTINAPKGTSEEELADLYVEFFPELKGLTVYPDGSRENQPLTPIDLEKAVEVYEQGKSETGESKCRSGVCDL